MTPIATRAAVAFFGAFGYELDPTALSADERPAGRRPDRVLQGPARAHPVRPLRAAPEPVRGRRQRDRLDGRRARPRAARDRRASTGSLNRPVPPADRLRLRGLDPARVYRVSGWPADRRPIERGQRDRPRRRRPDGGRTVPSRRTARRRRAGATSGPGCSCSRRSSAASPAPPTPAALSSLRLRGEQPLPPGEHSEALKLLTCRLRCAPGNSDGVRAHFGQRSGPAVPRAQASVRSPAVEPRIPRYVLRV